MQPIALLLALVAPQIAQEAYLKSSNTETLDRFGSAVSVDGDTLAIGARLEDSSAGGVNGNQAGNTATESGAAYVFVRSGGSWSQQAYLKAANPGDNDMFGQSIALSGDTLVVGAWGESSSSTGVNGNSANNGAPHSGAAYVFVRSGTVWSQQAYLKPANTDAGDQFGWTVDVSGDTIVVGAPYEGSASAMINGDASDNSRPGAGAAYVFVRNGTSWSQEAYLKAANAQGFADFGTSVSVSADTVVVGSPDEDSNATGVNGDDSNNLAPFSGAAYVFQRSGTDWTQEAYLKASNTGLGLFGADGDHFGEAVSISGDRVAVGAPGEESSATGIDGDQLDDSLYSAGAVYMFVRDTDGWSQEAYIKASNTYGGHFFGRSLSLRGESVLVGSPYEGSTSTGVNGSQVGNTAWSSGAAYLFRRMGAVWMQEAYIKASNSEYGDLFGDSVALSATTVLVGATGEASNATGVNGDQSNNSETLSGAGYAFVRSFGTSYCPLSPNSIGTGAQLAAYGSPSVLANDLVISVDGAAAAQPGLLLFGETQIQVPFGQGNRCVGSPLVRHWPTVTTDAAGTSSIAIDNTSISIATSVSPIVSGATRHFQFWFRDPAGGGFNLSDALSILFTL